MSRQTVPKKTKMKNLTKKKKTMQAQKQPTVRFRGKL